jgi:hypothetical protein
VSVILHPSSFIFFIFLVLFIHPSYISHHLSLPCDVSPLTELTLLLGKTFDLVFLGSQKALRPQNRGFEQLTSNDLASSEPN